MQNIVPDYVQGLVVVEKSFTPPPLNPSLRTAITHLMPGADAGEGCSRSQKDSRKNGKKVC